jgi:plasmid stability protein
MGQILVRNLDDDVIERLKAKALERGTSLEQLAREALTEEARQSDRTAWIARMDALRARMPADPGWDAAAEVRAARDELGRHHDHAEAGTQPRSRLG